MQFLKSSLNLTTPPLPTITTTSNHTFQDQRQADYEDRYSYLRLCLLRRHQKGEHSVGKQRITIVDNQVHSLKRESYNKSVDIL